MKNTLISLLSPAFLAVGILTACRSHTPTGHHGSAEIPQVDSNYNPTTLIVPEGFRADLLFSEGDAVTTLDGQTAPAKNKQDFLAFLPINGSPEHGWLWCNHESNQVSDVLGDGGGGTFLEVQKEAGGWKTIRKIAADFSPVGGTLFNCLGGVTPWGTVLTSEETEPYSNFILQRYCGIRDTTPIGGYPRHLNYGWVVEVDPQTKKAVRKLWSLGRFMHEGIWCAPDSMTVYLMDDEAPSVFFRFVSDRKGSYESGQLYAWRQRQAAKGMHGEWIALPMQRDSLNVIRDVAMRRGATIFIRMEDIILRNDGKFIITETGRDTVNLKRALALGGQPASHLSRLFANDTLLHDYYGRLLIYDPRTEKMDVYLEGGPGEHNQGIHFANPDNLDYHPGRNLLVIQEDINHSTFGRVPAWAYPNQVNEIWMLDVSTDSPRRDDLKRFAIGPRGSETTGILWSPDYSTLFINFQHPDPLNPPPFNKACTFSVSGFGH